MADKKLEVRVLTPTVRQEISPYRYQGEADMVIVRAITGDRGFLPGHENCSVILDVGITRVIGAAEDELKLAVLGGVAQFENNILTLITDEADWPENIDRNRVLARRDELLNLIEKAEHDELEELKKEFRATEVLVTVSGFPHSGMSSEK
jgi:F-type H+-transporting ATPase subunit epsilon